MINKRLTGGLGRKYFVLRGVRGEKVAPKGTGSPAGAPTL